MSNTSIDGQTQKIDVRNDRIAAGTIGDTVMIPRGVGGAALQSVIDDQDPRVNYVLLGSLASGSSFTYQTVRLDGFDNNGSTTTITTKGGGAALNFNGTSIGVMGQTGTAGTLRVYIDGIETAGRVPKFFTLSYTSYAGIGTSFLPKADTLIYVNSVTDFSVGGDYIIDREIFTVTALTVTNTDKFGVTSVGSGVLTATRGSYNTIPADHNVTTTIYLWSSRLNLTSTEVGLRRSLWYNPFLSPGNHTIYAVAADDQTPGSVSLTFDGFLVGSLIGQQNMALEYGTVTSTFTTDANGFALLPGGIYATRTGVSIIGVVAAQQLSPNPQTGATMAKLAMTAAGVGGVGWSLVNGPASTTVSYKILFSYMGETV